MLAVALAEHGHCWTAEERSAYDNAITQNNEDDEIDEVYQGWLNELVRKEELFNELLEASEEGLAALRHYQANSKHFAPHPAAKQLEATIAKAKGDAP